MELSLREVSKQYGETAAVDQVTFETADDTGVLVMIGPSGGGKSTLLRLIGGLETPTEGTIRHGGKKLGANESKLREFRRCNGFLFQHFNLFPHLTAVDNVVLPLTKVHGKTGEEAREKSLEMLEKFGLGGHASKMPAQLSGGQQQRVGLARAMAHQPGLLLLDEPTSALDPEMKAEVLDVIDELRKEGQKIILTTHEMGFARRVADEALFLAEGKALAFGNGPEFFAEPPNDEVASFLAKVMKW